jgi:hypothetical protein
VEFHLTKTIYSTTPRLLELSSSSSQQQDNVTAMPKQLQKPASAVNNTAISAPTFDDVIELKFFASGLDTFENVTLRTEGKQYSVR